MRKRILAALLSVCLVLSLAPAALAAEGAPELSFYMDAGCTEEISPGMAVAYFQLEDGKVYMKADSAVAESERGELSVYGIENQEVMWTDDTTAYAQLPEPERGFSYLANIWWGGEELINFEVASVMPVEAPTFEYEGTTFAVGFGYRTDTGIGIFNGSSSSSGETSSAPEERYENFSFFEAYVAEATEDDNGWVTYTEREGVTLSIDSVKLEPFSGDNDTFSLDNGGYAGERTDVADNSFNIYAKVGHTGGAFVRAEVTVYDGDTVIYEGSIGRSVEMFAYEAPKGFALYSSEDASEAARLENQDEYRYWSYDEPAVWLVVPEPLTEDELASLTIYADGEIINVNALEWNSEHTKLKITLSEPVEDRGYSLSINLGGEHMFIRVSAELGKGISVPVGNDTYIVGFAFGEGDTTIISEGNWTYSDITSAEKNEDNPRREWREMAVASGIQRFDENGNEYYEGINGSKVSVTVKSMEIKPVSGDRETFSWAETGAQQLVLGSVPGNSAHLYVKEGYAGTAQIAATVEISVKGGSTWTDTVAIKVEIERTVQSNEQRPNDDTVGALNAYLEGFVQGENAGKRSCTVTLAPITYTGTIVIPEEFLENDWDLFIFGYGDLGTKLVGGIDLNSSQAAIYDIWFEAPEGQGSSRAVYNGNSSNVDRCLFMGYDIAIDSDPSMINPHSSVFIGNDIAVRVNLTSQYNNSRSNWEYNTFIDNGIAIQVLKLNDFISPYYFRIYESNFIDNGVDFESSCGGKIYPYRNFYGSRDKAKDAPEDPVAFYNELAAGNDSRQFVKQQPPTVEDSKDSRVVTNPRWNWPVSGGQFITIPVSSGGSGSAAPMLLAAAAEDEANYLTADWERETEIVQEDAAKLKLDAAAFAETAEKDRIIDFVDKDGKILASWNFGTEGAGDKLTGSFDASVTIVREGDKVTVTVPDSPLLAELQPTLTIPNASGGVTHEGDTVESSEAAGGVSFVAGDSGGYVIDEATQPEEPEEPDTPDTPSNPGTPTTPVEPEEPEAEFTDVVPGAWYVDAVDYVVENGLMEGTSATTFEPDAHITRAMFWTILARIDGETITGATWATDAREWAMANSVSDGTDPNGRITREQLVTMLWRYLGEPESTGTLAAFTDAGTVSDWADEAMAWAVSEGIIGGVTMTTLVPNGSATRAQCATILMRQEF